MFNKAPHGKELSEDLRIRVVALYKDDLGYKRFSKMGFIRNRPRKGRSTKLSARSVLNLDSKNRCMSAASNALEVAKAE
ncbi:hypothetical protein M9458_034902, partial [Cirrhinus mrigala]